jgi:Flp pilus assembly protein CpaB
MRKSRQILLSVLLTVILLVAAYWSGRDQPDLRLVSVVALARDIASGAQLGESDLVVLQLPEHPALALYVADPVQAAGQWSQKRLKMGELLALSDLGPAAVGLVFPNPGPGRRLMTLELKLGDANGLYLTAGNHIDLHLVPKQQSRVESLQTIVDNVPVVAVLGTNGQPIQMPVSGQLSTVLLCLDVDQFQAQTLARAQSEAFIRVAVRNEPG